MPNLSKMPLKVGALIVDYLDLESVLAIRKCSKLLRDLAERRHFQLEFLQLILSARKIVVSLVISKSTLMKIEYCNHPSGCFVKQYKIERDSEFEPVERRALLQGESFVATAAADLKVLLSHLKTRIGMFSVQEVKGNLPLPQIKSLLKDFEHQVLVEELEVRAKVDAEDVKCLLEFSEPGTLKNIRFMRIMGTVESDWIQIVEMEQWKRAKVLFVRGCELTIEWVLHFKQASFLSDSIDLDEFKTLVERASNIENDDSYHFYMEVRRMNAEIRDYLTQSANLLRDDIPNRYHIQIPNSEHHLLIDINSMELMIRKIHTSNLKLNNRL